MSSSSVVRRDEEVRAPQGVRALLWLKSREWLGETRDPARLWLIGVLVASWTVLIVAGSLASVRSGRLDSTRGIVSVAAAAWPLWAVVPLLGGGGGEVVSAGRLAPYPVTARTVFGGAWATAIADLPYIAVLPVVIGVGAAHAGLAGAVLALLFAAGASATGQLMAWGSFLALAGRKRSGVAALVLTAGVVGLLAVLPELLPVGRSASRSLPGGWLVQAADAANAGAWGSVGRWALALAAPVPIALLVGPLLTRAALDREARGGGVGARPWGTAGWSARGTVRRVLVVGGLRSVGRAVGAQVALAGVLAVPAFTRLPGVNVAEVSLVAMGGVAGIAAATVLGVNSFAFDAGGATMLLSSPVRVRDVVAAKAVAVFGSLLLAQLAVTAIGAVALSSSPAEVTRCAVLSIARSALLTGAALLWSVRLPAASDYDSLRARISTPGAIASYCAVASFAAWAVAETSQQLRGPVGALMVTVTAGLICLVALERAAGLLDAEGVERVATAVGA